MKPIIGISTSFLTMENGMMPGLDRVYVNHDYIKAVEKAGGIPLMLPPITNEEDIKSQCDLCDGFIFSGGVDINPIYYEEDPHIKLGATNSELDKYQLALCKLIVEKNKPLLGICRGHQILNVALGGTLFQDLNALSYVAFNHVQKSKRYEASHKVSLRENSILSEIFGKEIFVNSYHHQSVAKLGRDLEIIATSNDDIVESIQLKNKKFILGVQWHPEMLLTDSDEMLPLFKKLIEISTIK